MYTGIVNNAKIQSLPTPLFKAWVNLLCLAKDNGGALPPLPDISFQLRCTEAQAKKWISDLSDRRLFDESSDGAGGKEICPHDWEQHQYVSDVSTNRVKKFRETQKKLRGNVSVTHSETEQRQSRDRADSETETFAAAAAHTPKPPPPSLQGWPVTTERIARRFPSVDDEMVCRIASAACAIDPGITDDSLAQVIDSEWKPGQNSAALFLKTVPAILRNRAAETAVRKAAEERNLRDAEARILEIYSRSDAETRLDLEKSWPELSDKWPKK